MPSGSKGLMQDHHTNQQNGRNSSSGQDCCKYTPCSLAICNLASMPASHPDTPPTLLSIIPQPWSLQMNSKGSYGLSSPKAVTLAHSLELKWKNSLAPSNHHLSISSPSPQNQESSDWSNISHFPTPTKIISPPSTASLTPTDIHAHGAPSAPFASSFGDSHLALKWQYEMLKKPTEQSHSIPHNGQEHLGSGGGVYGLAGDAGAQLMRARGIGPLLKWVDDHLFFRILTEHIQQYNSQ
ncbi:hypothetical protein BDQ12DRAFT_729674 [Crucibulum laeve]|uniref:Uncharacterized protein n=1 Tax=Crucibulum laeve TaxID=68775 RepID=A0A5C3LHB5_9AGAR|nr:hypothetical protein BDQ12DRAFT_729674 [Crucibulum laeve]